MTVEQINAVNKHLIQCMFIVVVFVADVIKQNTAFVFAVVCVLLLV